MDEEAILLIEAFTTHKKELKKAFHCALSNPKNSEASERVRKDGNALFMQESHTNDLHKEILALYNQSACLAPIDSQELTLALANRSAFLLHIGKYEECVRDIEKALTTAESDELKVKLLCRKVECLKNLGNTTHKNVLDKAQSLVDNIDDGNQNKQMLNGLIHKASMLSVKKLDEIDEIDETFNLPVTDNVLEKVSVKHNEKYGRHLVAEQNYNSGDIILVDKLFSAAVNNSHRYTNCHYCLNTCWSGVPCDHCDWALFCSQDCKQKAWREYHDIECSVGHFLNDQVEFGWSPCYNILKIFIKAMKDAGSVANLRIQLEAVDECTDECYKGFMKDGKFVSNTLQSFYSLTKMRYSQFPIENISLIALMILIGLLKHPQLTNMYHVKKVKDLIRNKDIVFLGSALIKFTAIGYNNLFSMSNTSEKTRGLGVASVVSFVNHSCYPNASLCFTKDGTVILYALQPIERDSQIFVSYCGHYNSTHLEERQKYFKRRNFKCDCQACTESWPPVLMTKYFSIFEGKTDDFSESDFELISQFRDVAVDAILNYNKAALDKLTAEIARSLKSMKQPSIFTCVMQNALKDCIIHVYHGFESQLLEACNKMTEE